MKLKMVMVLIIAVFAIGSVTGCQNGQSTPTAAAPVAVPHRAVVITTGQGTTAVYVPSPNSPNGVERLASDKDGPACMQCELDAKAYILNGTAMPAKCSVCGATRVPVTVQETHATN